MDKREDRGKRELTEKVDLYEVNCNTVTRKRREQTDSSCRAYGCRYASDAEFLGDVDIEKGSILSFAFISECVLFRRRREETAAYTVEATSHS